MTPQEVLDRIAALCDDAESGDYPTLPAKFFVRTVRKVLADVTPETGATRQEIAREVLRDVERVWDDDTGCLSGAALRQVAEKWEATR